MRIKYVFLLLVLVLIICCIMGCKVKEPEEKGVTDALGISDGYFDSDGIIESMDATELIAKLSLLEAGMAIEDVVDVFGKEPFTIIETGEDVYQYYCGDITITLWGKELFQVEVMVDNGESCIWLALQPETMIRENEAE